MKPQFMLELEAVLRYVTYKRRIERLEAWKDRWLQKVSGAASLSNFALAEYSDVEDAVIENQKRALGGSMADAGITITKKPATHHAGTIYMSEAWCIKADPYIEVEGLPDATENKSPSLMLDGMKIETLGMDITGITNIQTEDVSDAMDSFRYMVNSYFKNWGKE